MKKMYLVLISLFSLCTLTMSAKSKKIASIKQIKDKTCQNIKDLFLELTKRLEETKTTDIQKFLEENDDFFTAHSTKIKRYMTTMNTFSITSEKRTAQKELDLITSFYISYHINNPENEEQICEYVNIHTKREVEFKNRCWNPYLLAHKTTQSLSFSFTDFAKQMKKIIKFVKKSKNIIPSKLFYSHLNKLESVYYTLIHQGEYKHEKRKQRLRFGADFVTNFLTNLN